MSSFSLLQLLCFLCIIGWAHAWKLSHREWPKLKVCGQKAMAAIVAAGLAFTGPVATLAAEDTVPIERYFNAIRVEIDPVKGESLKRLKADIEEGRWDDVKAFTRQYDAGFRGTVLKGAWKSMEGEARNKGVQLSNAFTFDLIGLNKAARVGDREEALHRLDVIKEDLQAFLGLENAISQAVN